MPRLFTAIELPDGLVWDLSMLQGGLTGAHWLDPADYHLTLRFAGDIGGADANRFLDALYGIRFESFDLQVCGLGSFGGHRPRSLWAALKPSSELNALQRAHERAARSAGLAPETRNYTPHITLARLRNVRPHTVAEYLDRYGGFCADPFPVQAFSLLSARPGCGGGPYLVEESFRAFDAAFEDEEALGLPLETGCGG